MFKKNSLYIPIQNFDILLQVFYSTSYNNLYTFKENTKISSMNMLTNIKFKNKCFLTQGARFVLNWHMCFNSNIKFKIYFVSLNLWNKKKLFRIQS